MNNDLKQFYLKWPKKTGELLIWQNLFGLAKAFAIWQLARQSGQPIVLIAPDILTINRLEEELKFFAAKNEATLPILVFPDLETLPYDQFSPHQDIIAERIFTLYQLPNLQNGIILIAATTIMQRLPPCDYIFGHSLLLNVGDKINLDAFRKNLTVSGYRQVAQVMEHGEFAVRGSLLDIFPMGSEAPFRLDFFDDELESIRIFDLETQISKEKISSIKLLPAKEFPLTEDAIAKFRQNWRRFFPGNPSNCPIYQNISNGLSAAGIEYYLPLFFDKLAGFHDYLPQNSLIVTLEETPTTQIQEKQWREINNRYEQLVHDQLNPILAPIEVFFSVAELNQHLNERPRIKISGRAIDAEKEYLINFTTLPLPDLSLNYQEKRSLAKLENFLAEMPKSKVLFCAESLGRQENLLNLLKKGGLEPVATSSWQEFLSKENKIALTVAPLEDGMVLMATAQPNVNLIVIPESALLGKQVMQRRLRKKAEINTENVIRNLTELNIGDPVVHLEHGVGRYLGLQALTTDVQETEFLVLEYAEKAKLYVPITALNLISRYTGIDAEHAPLHYLGKKEWQKIKEQAKAKIRDVAAELLALYAKRAAQTGFAFKINDEEFAKFCAAFPFEATLDQIRATEEVLSDMAKPKPMDRLVCGDVGFGKTEVAMRATFVAVENAKQVAVLTPTTLLAEQHYNNFCDRFAAWPMKIAMLSRFSTSKEQKETLTALKEGKIDIVIGTHKLLQKNIAFKELGLLIIDEEHRFGVKQKEIIKKLKPDVDILTLTATPIPRTLNLALSGMRDFSIIGTPPKGRLNIKTFVEPRNNYHLREAILREIMRGGQVYFLNNDISRIGAIAQDLQKLVPEANLAIAHGQMRERELERIMGDFYHRRFNLLVCTTIIESGIDIPTANTIIINRADRFGLAELHQLRGRVGRSHHQAYAYLLIPQDVNLSATAKKRLQALTQMEDLGIGFCLATRDLEIRGAGEFLGEKQSGCLAELGFDLYMEYLEKAIQAYKKGETISFDIAAEKTVEVELQIAALIPEDYLSDINMRLVLYKRIASAKSGEELEDLRAEMIDRFGILPKATVSLFEIAQLKLELASLGIDKLTGSNKELVIDFAATPKINGAKVIALMQKEPNSFRFRGKNRLVWLWQKKPEERLVAVRELLTRLV